jgi:hypothetical protein
MKFSKIILLLVVFCFSSNYPAALNLKKFTQEWLFLEIHCKRNNPRKAENILFHLILSVQNWRNIILWRKPHQLITGGGFCRLFSYMLQKCKLYEAQIYPLLAEILLLGINQTETNYIWSRKLKSITPRCLKLVTYEFLYYYWKFITISCVMMMLHFFRGHSDYQMYFSTLRIN